MEPNQYSLDIGNRHNCTLPAEERNPIKQKWDCDQYLAFDNYEASYQVIGLVTKTYQLILFIALLTALVYRRYNYSHSQISLFPLVVTIFVILDGIFTLLRINAMFPLSLNEDAHLYRAVVY